MTGTRWTPAAVAVALCLGAATTTGRQSASTGLLDRYLRGDFDAVVAAVDARDDLGATLDDLKDNGPRWIDAGGASGRERRRLAAATFALEAARLGARREWKLRQRLPLPTDLYPPGEFVRWYPATRLVEWGCALFRDAAPAPHERLWHLAALSVAERAQDYEFLAGALVGGSRTGFDSPINFEDEIEHLKHVRTRFPSEPRVELAAAMATEMITFPGARSPQQARAALTALQDDEDVGGEATMRLGYLRSRLKDDNGAIEAFDKVERLTLDPWVLYLARYFKGQSLERRNRPADAERAYRGALAAVPGAQSASVALATLLSKGDRRAAASDVIRAMFETTPKPADPWREYPDGDDRFWPALIAQLRLEIAR
jgi:tetratricopeptide (TPR) repeat protein